MSAKVWVQTVDGTVACEELSLGWSVLEAKKAIFPNQDVKFFCNGAKLKDKSLLSEVGLKSDDFIVVVNSRPLATPTSNKDSIAPPTALQIRDVLRAHAKPQTTPTRLPSNSRFRIPEAQFKQQLRELVHTLANIGSSIQDNQQQPGQPSATPENADIAPATANIPNLRDNPLLVDEESLEQLTSMGYQEPLARKALLLNRLSPMLAMDWLLQHEGDENLDDPLTTEQEQQIVARAQRDNFRPNPMAFEQLRDMGFKRYDILAALRATRNDQEAACAWLLGDRDTSLNDLDLDEPVGTMPPDHPVVQHILANPRIQAGLKNPRIIEALRAVANNPMIAVEICLDPEIGRVLMEIWEVSWQHRDAFELEAPSSSSQASSSAIQAPSRNDDEAGSATQTPQRPADESQVSRSPQNDTQQQQENTEDMDLVD